MMRSLLGASVGWLGISMVADGVPALLLPHQLARGGPADATALGIITLVAIAVAAAVQPLAGHWADRFGRLPVAAAGTFLGILGLGLMLQDGAAAFATVLALTGVSVAQAGQQPLLPDLVPARLRGRGGGLKSAFDVGGAFIAFVVLAMTLGSGDPGAAVGALGVALVVGLGLTAVLVGREGLARRTSTRRTVIDAYRLDLARHGDIATIVVARFLFLLGVYAVGRFLLFFVAGRLGLSADAAGERAGIALALLAAITVIASLPGGWLADRVGRRPLVLIGGGLAASGIALLPLAQSLEAIVALGALMSIGTAAFSAASWAMLADASASPESGRLLGLAHVGTAGAAAAAGLFGLVIDASGYELAFAIAAGFTMAGGVVGWRSVATGPRAVIRSAEAVR